MTITNSLTQQIIQYITLRGGLAWRNNTGAYKSDTRFIKYGKVGSGDVLAVYRGKFMTIEIKVGLDKLSPDQESWMERVESCEGVAVVAHTLEDVIAALERIDTLEDVKQRA